MKETGPAGVVHRGDEASGAVFSSCGRYRYALWRRWGDGPAVAFIGLNPSTADHRHDDPTIRRCVGFARRWGFGAVHVTNLFAYRATRPADLKSVPKPVGAHNDQVLSTLGRVADLVVAAWGVHGAHRARERRVRALVPDLRCLGLTRDGHPRHPLYLRRDAALQAFSSQPPSP